MALTVYEKALKRYNKLMFDLCMEHLSIGTNYSEDTDGWNIRDMVSECQYHLDVCYEENNANNEGQSIQNMLDCGWSYAEAEREHKYWLSKTGKLRRFIEAFKPYIKELKCTVGHCSNYD